MNSLKFLGLFVAFSFVFCASAHAETMLKQSRVTCHLAQGHLEIEVTGNIVLDSDTLELVKEDTEAFCDQLLNTIGPDYNPLSYSFEGNVISPRARSILGMEDRDMNVSHHPRSRSRK